MFHRRQNIQAFPTFRAFNSLSQWLNHAIDNAYQRSFNSPINHSINNALIDQPGNRAITHSSDILSFYKKKQISIHCGIIFLIEWLNIIHLICKHSIQSSNVCVIISTATNFIITITIIIAITIVIVIIIVVDVGIMRIVDMKIIWVLSWFRTHYYHPSYLILSFIPIFTHQSIHPPIHHSILHFRCT